MRALAYRATEAGIARIAAERRQAMLPAPEAPEQVEAPVAAPVVEAEPEPESNVVAFRTPRDELRTIIDLVARMHGSSYQKVLSPLRAYKHVQARQAAICAIKAIRPEMSLSQMGSLFGRDHSSIVHAMRKRGFK